SGMVQAMFYGLGSDGTVGANKNSIKIIGSETDNYAQGYFVYDSKKAGAITVSHLRFGPKPIRSTYLIGKADFIACHQFSFLEKYDMLRNIKTGGTFLLNCPMNPQNVWDHMPEKVQQQIIDKKLKFYAIDAYEVAKATGMGGRINTIMQTCFFALSGVLPKDEAIRKIKDAIKKTYSKKGEEVVKKNYDAVDATLAGLVEISVPAKATSGIEMPPTVSEKAPQFVKDVTATIMAGNGDDLPVSKIPDDGTWPTGTTQWEKRNIALDIPQWDPETCIQCGKCSLVCPHAAIRLKIYDPSVLANAPAEFKSADAKTKAFEGKKATIQIAPEDCTGCGACVFTCPGRNKQNPDRKAINMTPQAPVREQERKNYEFFLSIPDYDRMHLNTATVKGSQLCRPLFEYSGACAGCGETPYVKLLTQLFGDRLIVGNATGCSSIYGGNLPTTPYAKDANGRGPAWNNSLFEDNAEFTFGFRLTMEKRMQYAKELAVACKDIIGAELAEALVNNADLRDEPSIFEQRKRIEDAKAKLAASKESKARQFDSVIDTLVHKSIWAMGGDGWAYDIGYGGLDHCLACARDYNVIVLDTMVYSNTGGQASKSTPRGAVAQFAASGKGTPRKDLGMIAMTYGNIYVAQIAMGANDAQAVKALVEADSYQGSSIIICYSHCIAQGINMTEGMARQKAAVDSGFWPLYRFDPRRAAEGKNPLQLDSKEPTISFEDYAYHENRWKMLTKMNPERAKKLLVEASSDVISKWHLIKQMAEMSYAMPAEKAAE
ncbi:MAG TPA: pyruvate:ferredoxin (flavodoxin) oxidoreductase, partial [Phycisphaerae bacterium]|nr:pyruvate:ferredoxin (flavodoxin) oxidoreductase [Phycisphaerae bacterium]